MSSAYWEFWKLKGDRRILRRMTRTAFWTKIMKMLNLGRGRMG
jgi:hypothetical protein